MKFKLIYIVATFFYGYTTLAQDILPFVENFSKSNYKGENQVWSVGQGNDNAMYFANNLYFIRYNGVKWEKYSLPNKTIIRSVFAVGDRIYSGSYNEFGYWKRIEGKMIYFSLSQKKNLFSGKSINEEIWKIFKFKNSIYFQSFNQLFVYDGKLIKQLDFPDQISYCFLVEDKIYVASVNKGIYILENNQFVNQQQWSILNNTIVHGIEKKNNKTYFFTRKNGVYEENNGKIKPWENSVLNAILKVEIINTAKFIDDYRVAIGTSFNGIYIVNINDGSYININRKNSLLNNSVLSIGFDKENDLWLGLDNGISHIEINSPYTIFSDNTGVLGSVYDIYPNQNGYLLGSNHGLFNYKNKKLSFISGSQGQVWQIDKINNSFIIGHNDGTFEYKNNLLTKINNKNGGWKLLKNIDSNQYFQGNYSGLIVYNNDTFNSYKPILGLTKPIKNLVQNKKGELWAVDSYKGLYKIEFDANLNTTKTTNITKQNGMYNDFNVKVFSFKNEVLFYINSKWYRFNAITTKLELFELFNKNFNSISNIIPIDDSKFLIVKDQLLYLIHNHGTNFYWELLPKKYYDGKIVNEDTKVLVDGHKLVINLDDGFLTYVPQNSKVENYEIRIEGYLKNELIPENSKIKHNQEIELNIISPYYGFKEKNLFYELNDSEEYLPISRKKIVLNNLYSGNQKITIYYLFKNNYKKLSSYRFKVLKPWYFSSLMVLVYLIIISLALFIYYKWNNIRYNEKIKLKENELKHEKQILQIEMDAKNSSKLQEYEKHILEIQIQTKASEVASKSLSIAKQTELIENIHSILDKEKNITSLKSQISKVIKINSLNKNEWKSFENNLLKSNEDFVKVLTTKYKNLTSKDIKICIYLKMNLSSKEIAPLMNISYRGVELHRYRLRKKLEIDPKISLNLFMNSII